MDHPQRDAQFRYINEQAMAGLRGRSTVVDGGPFTFTRFTQRCAEVFEVGEAIAA